MQNRPELLLSRTSPKSAFHRSPSCPYSLHSTPTSSVPSGSNEMIKLDPSSSKKNPTRSAMLRKKNLQLDEAESSKEVHSHSFKSDTQNAVIMKTRCATLPNQQQMKRKNISPGQGLTQKLASPKLSEKLSKNLKNNINLTESIMGGTAKAIDDSVVKSNEKDLHMELQIRELKLNGLDKKINVCLENSRRTLSMTDVLSQHTNDLFSPDKTTPTDSINGSPCRSNNLSLKSIKLFDCSGLKPREVFIETTPMKIDLQGELRVKRSSPMIPENDFTSKEITIIDQLSPIISNKDSHEVFQKEIFTPPTFKPTKQEKSRPSRPSTAGQDTKINNITAQNKGKEEAYGTGFEESNYQKQARTMSKQASSNNLAAPVRTMASSAQKDKMDRKTKSWSITPKEIPCYVFENDPQDGIGDKGFFSTQGKYREGSIDPKQQDFSFKDLLHTVQPFGQKALSPQNQMAQDKLAFFQNMGLGSPIEFQQGKSIPNAKENVSKALEQDHKKNLRNNILFTNTSNDYKTIEELKDLLSVLQNLDAKAMSHHSESFGISFLGTKDNGGNQEIDNKQRKTGGNNDRQGNKIEKKLKTMRENEREKGSRLKMRSQESLEVPIKEEDIESNFEKAFTLMKTQVMSQGGTFEERMESDIYLRRQFQLELEEFKKTMKPKMTSQEASRLYSKLVEDGKKRTLRTEKTEQEKEITMRNSRLGHVRHQSDALMITQGDNEKLKVFERLVDDSKERVRDKQKRELEKQIKTGNVEGEGSKGERMKKMDKESVDNLVNKLLQDAERRKLSAERIRLAKEEEEKQAMAKSHVFTNKNNKAESKVKQYIQGNRENTQPSSTTDIQKLEREFWSQEKVKKRVRFSVDKGAGVTAQNDLFSNVLQPKNSIATINKENMDSGIDRDVQNICLKHAESESNLEYLKGLRADIEKIKEKIELKIQGIERESTCASKELDEKPGEKPVIKSILKKSQEPTPKLSRNNSLERLYDRSQKVKVKTRFQNVNSRMQQAETGPNEWTPCHKKGSRTLTGAELLGNIPNTSGCSTTSSKSKGKGNAGAWPKGEQKARETQNNKPGFMNDLKAASYVDQLIKEFREVNNIRK